MTTMIDDLDIEIEQPVRRRRRVLLWLTLGVVVAGAGAAYWYVTQDDGAEPASTTSGPAATAEVTRATLAATETFEGTLGHGEATTVAAAGQGTVTRLPEQDAVIERGTELYRLNERPVTAMIGAIPMYRDLRAGDTGIDVEQFEANLAALGYDGFTVDDEFTSYTALAVEQWQDDIGADETGAVTRADIVFLPEGGRVDSRHADVGGVIGPGAPVLDVTGSEQVVGMDVDMADRDLLTLDTGVTIQLPGGDEVGGKVTAADVVEAQPAADESGTGGEESTGADNAVVQVEVTLNRAVDEAFEGSPVDAVINVDARKDVLVVPVNALLALSEGGYGLEVVGADGTTSTVPVEAGLFANGSVEVKGAGIDEGTVVGVAGR